MAFLNPMNSRPRIALAGALSLALLPACGDSSSDGDDEVGETAGDSGTDAATDTGDESGSSSSTDTTGDGDTDTTSTTGDGDTGTTSTDTTGDGDTGTTDTTGDGDTGTTDTSGDTGTTDTGDTGMMDTGSTDTGNLDLPAWILSIDEPDATTDRLVRISVAAGEEGTTTVICDDIELPPGIPDDTNFTSLTFNSDVLYASAQDDIIGDTLMIVDPCDCVATEVGKYGYSRVNGITSNADQVMFGIAVTEDVIIDIDPLTAMSQLLQALGANWGSTGLTWSEPMDNVLYGINASTDRLHTFDGNTAVDLGSIQMNGNFASVGMELHPSFGTLYACGISGQQSSLFQVDTQSGDVSLVAPTGLAANCDNLAAPFGPVECVPQ